MFEMDIIHILDNVITFELSDKRQFAVWITDFETRRKVLNHFIQGNSFVQGFQGRKFICGFQGLGTLELLGSDKHVKIQ